MTLDSIKPSAWRSVWGEVNEHQDSDFRLPLYDETAVRAYAAGRVAAALLPCVVNQYLSCVCLCGTKGCNVTHDWVKTQADVDEQVAAAREIAHNAGFTEASRIHGAEIESYKQDAERYRYLRSFTKPNVSGEEFDATVDAAIRARRSQENATQDKALSKAREER